MHRFANPAKFNRLADQILPWAIIAGLIAFAVGIYYALFNSPPDYQQGESVRMMYVHVPAAWASMSIYGFIAITSFIALVWRHPLALLAGKAAAPIGATITALALITGALWGKPMWGTYWQWDARMTSVLVMFFLYLGYSALWQAMEDEEKAGRAASILALVGVVNLPIIKFSVEWWNTLHQSASIMRMDGPSMPAEMLKPLFIMGIAYQLYFIVVVLWRMKMEISKRKIEALRQLAASNEA